MHYRKVSARPEWTKADVIAGNRIKLELFRRFGVLPGSSDTHVAEFFPGFVTPLSDFGREWSVHHYGLSGHMADKAADDAGVEEMLATDEITRMPSGELVAPLLDSLLTRRPRPLPVNLPNTGQVENLDAGVVVECIGLGRGRRGAPARSRDGAVDHGRVPAARRVRRGVDGRGRADRQPDDRARRDARRPARGASALRGGRHDDRTAARGDRRLAAPVQEPCSSESAVPSYA